MTQKTHDVLAEIISAIGCQNFMETATTALRRIGGYDFAATVLHRNSGASLLFEDFGAYRGGVEIYVRHTSHLNPMRHIGVSVVRARDFRRLNQTIPSELRPYVVEAPEEELGYRTVGWPHGLEEIGLYFDAGGGTVEIGLYRAQCSTASHSLRELEELSAPVAAAFRRHASLTHASLPGILSPREQKVVELMLKGCDSAAIAVRLGISLYTVKDHRKNIFRKLKVASLTELFTRLRDDPQKFGIH